MEFRVTQVSSGLNATSEALQKQSAHSGLNASGKSIVMISLLLIICQAIHAQNVITNGDFDDDINGWVAASGSLSHDDTEGSTSGPGSMRIFTSNSDSRARQCVTGVLPSTTYDFGGDFRLEAGGPLNFCRVQIEEYSSGNCAGVSNIQSLAEQIFVQASPVYTSLASSFVTEANTNALKVDLFCSENVTNHTVFWDDVFLIPDLGDPVTYTLLTGFSDVLYHMPGDNGLIGDDDDLISADPSTIIGSDPNYRGAFSYRSGRIFNTPAEPGLFDGHNRLNYLEGTVDVIEGFGFVDSDLMRTGQRQGHGLRGWSGPVGRDYLIGDILTFDAPFPVTGNAYIDNVLIPKAEQLGASGLLYADLSGTRPPNDNHPNGLPERHVYIGVTGLPARGGSDPDLAVSKTVNVVGLQSPGTLASYTLNVSNPGPGDATGVLLADRIPDAVSYLGNDCGAPAPVNNLLQWSIGALSGGSNLSCQVTVQVNADSNFDVFNGAIAYGEQWDPNLDNNANEAVIEVLDGEGPGIVQVPDQVTGFQSDFACGACGSGNQAIADAFKVDSGIEICGLTFFGGYSDNQPFNDQFLIDIYDNNRVTPGIPGVPGDPILSLNGPVLRTPTGQQIAGSFNEYRYNVILPIGGGPILGRGKYWLVIVNDSTGTRGGGGDWFWESGSPDQLGLSIPGLVFNPGFDDASRGWGPNPAVETAFTLCANSATPPSPEIFEDGFE